MEKPQLLLQSLDTLDFDFYVSLCDDLLVINKSDLMGELANQSKRHGYWSGVYAEAKKRKNKAETDLDHYMASEKKRFREDNKSSIRKLTASDIQAHAESTPQYKLLKEKLANSAYKVDLVKGLLDAMSQRHSMLIQLSANNREEAKLITG